MNFLSKLSESKKIKQCIADLFEELFKRSADTKTINYHYLRILGGLSLDDLRNNLMNSLEYKLSYPIGDVSKLNNEERMKKEWDARAKLDHKFVIHAVPNETEEGFWNSGQHDLDFILGRTVGISQHELIPGINDPQKMRCLEIGCGVGRILIPMSKIFGEVIGVDISTEMVILGKKNVENIKNCKILQNSGSDLTIFSDNYFDFCYSLIVFQHLLDKQTVEKYFKEVSRVLKNDGIFWVQVRGITDDFPKEITTWSGIQFTSEEIHQIALQNNFKVMQEFGENTGYYCLIFKCLK